MLWSGVAFREDGVLGLVLAFGSWPAFVRVHDSMPLANNLRSTGR